MKRIKAITILMMAAFMCVAAVASANDVSFYDSVNEWIVTAYSEENPTQGGSYSVYLNILNKDGVRVEADLILLTQDDNRLDPQTNWDYLICGCAVSDQISLAYNTSGGQSEIFVLDRHIENDIEKVKVHNHIHLSGFSMPDPPNISVSGNGSFGNVNVGSTSMNSFRVSNTGEANLVLGTIGPLGTGFTLSSDNCSGQTLAADGYCDITITFAPTAATTYYGTLAIPSNDPTPPSNITLSGTGQATNPTGNVDITYPSWGAISAPSSAERGQSFPVKVKIVNNGTDPSGSFAVKLYLSTNTAFDSGDRLLGTWNVSQLYPGQTPEYTYSVVVTDAVIHTYYYLIAVADADNVVTETNENNNIAMRSISFSR